MRFLVGVLLVVGCGPQARDWGVRETADVALDGEAPLDVLIVVDNSVTMEAEQMLLSFEIRRFLDALGASGGLPDLRVGVVTSDLATLVPSGDSRCNDSDEGMLQAGSCGIVGNYLFDGIDGVNYSGTLADAVGCMIRIGLDGCGFEHHLEAMHIAVTASELLRPEADLVVIILGDEDDCSISSRDFFTVLPTSDYSCFAAGVRCEPDAPDQAGAKTGCASREDSMYVHPVKRYVDLLTMIKPDPRRVTLGVITGPPAPVVAVANMVDPTRMRLASPCDATTSFPGPSIRLAQFADAFPDHHVMISACDASYDGLTELGMLAYASISRPACFAGTVEGDCLVELVAPGQPDVVIQACEVNANPPCWRLREDPTTCPDGAHHRVELVTAGALPPLARLRATCTIES